ncbi:hypothetical protein SCHPADRAFT_928582 [Schizopora paradoxa]|uniref:Uncharacterized protein n=1 Tax=Schizopora paradoxa TaxID=27342 RepID=A0A0H2S9A3_9AGAM|nr:hypothetical protein SCHPADRAFT_928582 [Schizopora paradoxa]
MAKGEGRALEQRIVWFTFTTPCTDIEATHLKTPGAQDFMSPANIAHRARLGFPETKQALRLPPVFWLGAVQSLQYKWHSDQRLSQSFPIEGEDSGYTEGSMEALPALLGGASQLRSEAQHRPCEDEHESENKDEEENTWQIEEKDVLTTVRPLREIGAE